AATCAESVAFSDAVRNSPASGTTRPPPRQSSTASFDQPSGLEYPRAATWIVTAETASGRSGSTKPASVSHVLSVNVRTSTDAPRSTDSARFTSTASEIGSPSQSARSLTVASGVCAAMSGPDGDGHGPLRVERGRADECVDDRL